MLQFRKRFVFIVLGLILFGQSFAAAQKAVRVERIIQDAVRAGGGKKRLAAIKNTVYEWKAVSGENSILRVQIVQPGAWRLDAGAAAAGALDLRVDATTATNGSAVWRSDATGGLQTLSDAESKALRLQAVLAATRFVDFNKQRIGARVVGQPIVENEPTVAVEFAARNGAKINYYFGANSKMPVKIENPALGYSFCFADYRAENGVLEPHKLVNDCGSKDAQTFELVRVATNTNLTAAVFDPPRTLENFDINALLKELQKNENELLARLNQYSFTQTSIEREFDDKGAVKKETRKVYEVFPTRARRNVLKLVSENGVALSGERLEKENQRVAKELTEAEEEYEKELAKREKQRLEQQNGRNGDAPDEAQLERNTISTLLQISELYSPRIERFRDREVIVVNFRPRAGFKPRNLNERIFAQLAGTAWIDREDKQIVRAEARVVETVGAGGFVFKLRKDTALVFERTKFDNDIWLPKLFQANAAIKIFLVRSIDAAIENEYGDYKKYSTDAKDYKLDSPNGEKQNP